MTLPFHESGHLLWIPEPVPDNLALAPKGFTRLQTGGKDTTYECGLTVTCDKHTSSRNQIVLFLLRNNSPLDFSEFSKWYKISTILLKGDGCTFISNKMMAIPKIKIFTHQSQWSLSVPPGITHIIRPKHQSLRLFPLCKFSTKYRPVAAFICWSRRVISQQ